MHQKNTTILLILAWTALCFNQSQAQYALRTISNPGPFYDTWAYGISGTNIVGSYDSVNDGHGSLQGFLYDGSNFTTLTVPDAIYFTEAFGISGHYIVGSYGNNSGFYGFLYDGTNYTTLTVPGANATWAYGISGDRVVGYYVIGPGSSYTNQGFLYDGGTYTTLSYPGAVDTYPQGISGHNVVGYYDYGTDTYDDPINPQGFLYDGTNYVTLSVPGAAYTQAYGISGNKIVGTSSLGSFLYDGSSYTILDFSLPLPPVCRGICGNNIVGYYLAVTGYMQGLLATPAPVPPVIICPVPLVLECENGATDGTVQVTVQESSDIPVQVVWTVDDDPYQTNTIPAGGAIAPTNLTLTSTFGTGEHFIGVSASNGQGTPTTCSTTVTVSDLMPPQIVSIETIPKVLWPPDHRMVPVNVIANAVDNCDPSPVAKITRVTSNEPENHFAPDWEITGPLSVNLRADRLGRGQGRIYTIQIQCEDSSGNISYDSVNVAVPHDKK